MGYKGNGYVVICTLEPKPFPSVRLNNHFTRIDYTAKCTLKDVLEGMAGILKVSIDDLTLETKDGKGVILDQSLVDFYDQHTEPRSSCIDGKWHRWPRYVKNRRKEINLKVRHTAPPNRLVTCIVGGGEGRDALRRTTVLLSNMATFGELLIRARSQRYGAIQREGPVYGQPGELETTLRDAWIRDGCEVDGTLHIGLVVVVSVCGWFGMPLSLVMRPSDIISDVKRRISSDQGIPERLQILSIQAGQQRLNDGASLIGCCNVGGEVNQPSGWSELHLELNVKNFSFSPTNPFTVMVGRAKDANRFPSVASHKCYSESGGEQTSPIAPPSLWWGRHSSSSPPPSSFPPASPGSFSQGTIVQIGNAFVKDIVKRRSKSFRGNAPWPVEFFALSPSGRALTLSVPQDGSVLDAKEQIETHEGVPPYHQRLLWRGIPLEPDHASLHELGVRGRDTLILGYRIPRFPPDLSTPVIQVGNSQRFVPGQAGPGCKFATRDGTSSSIYLAGNTTLGEDERMVGMPHRVGYPRGFRAMDNRVDSESGGIWGSSNRQSNGSWPANAKFQNYKRNAGRGVGRNGSLPRGGGYANVGTRQPLTSGRGDGQIFRGGCHGSTVVVRPRLQHLRAGAGEGGGGAGGADD